MKHHKMPCTKLTITTDASFFSETNTAAYAIWISTDTGKIMVSDLFKTPLPSILEAEFKAIINALHIVISQVDMAGLKWILINTDNKTCMHIVNATSGQRKKHPELSRLFAMYRARIPARVSILARHVKAHQGTDTPRQYVNEWCDREAKQHARKKHYSIVNQR